MIKHSFYACSFQLCTRGGNAISKSHKSKGGGEERKYKMKPINQASTSRWL